MTRPPAPPSPGPRPRGSPSQGGGAADPERRERAHVPEEVTVQTEPESALALVDRARAWEVPFRVVVADAGYGANPAFLAGLEDRQLPSVRALGRPVGVRLPDEVRQAAAAVPETPNGKGRPQLPRPAPPGTLRVTVEAVAAAPPESAWRTITWREGTTGELRQQFLAVRAHRATGGGSRGKDGKRATPSRVSTGSEGRLPAERPVPGEEGERTYSDSPLPAAVPRERLATPAHARRRVEQFYEDAEGECGLEDYQGRRGDGLHRHRALAMLTYSVRTPQRPAAPDPAEGGFPPPSAPRMTFPAAHRQVLAWLFQDPAQWLIVTDQVNLSRPRRN
ncbi:MAG: transposase [Chloroflexi bacterium]|nr:transposase [Chloroflexota bacterium]